MESGSPPSAGVSIQPLREAPGRCLSRTWGQRAAATGVVAAVLVTILASAGGSQPADRWVGLQGGAQRLGAAPDSTPRPPLRRAWRARSGLGGGLSTPVVLPGLAVAAGQREVVGVDPATGRTLWTAPRELGPLVPPVVDPDGGILAFPEGNRPERSALAAIDLETRQRRWEVSLSGPSTSAPLIAGGLVVTASTDGSVYGVEATTGRLRWRARTGGSLETSPAARDGRVFVVTEDRRSGRATVHCLDLATGRRRWTFSPTGLTAGASSPLVAGDLVYVGFGDLRVRAIEADTGRVRWTGRVLSGFSPHSVPALAGGRLYVADRGGGIYRFRAGDGELEWRHQFAQLVEWGSPLVSPSAVFVGLEDGSLVALRVGDGHLVWRGSLGASRAGALAPAGSLLLAPALGRGGGLVAFETDPRGELLDVPSPTEVDLARALANFVLAAGGMLLAVGALSRLASLRRPAPTARAGSRGFPPSRGSHRPLPGRGR